MIDLRTLRARTSLDAIADAGVAAEINGAGMHRYGWPYPDAAILARLGVEKVAGFRRRGVAG